MAPSSKSVSAVATASSTVASWFTSVFGKHDVLFYVCVVVILFYIAMARPENTPAFFSTAAAKVILTFIIFLVTIHDPILGLIFGVAMVLSISYSYINNMNIDNYSFSNRTKYDSFQDYSAPVAPPPTDSCPASMDPSIMSCGQQNDPMSYVAGTDAESEGLGAAAASTDEVVGYSSETQGGAPL
jgi:hypothetical protein